MHMMIRSQKMKLKVVVVKQMTDPMKVNGEFSPSTGTEINRKHITHYLPQSVSHIIV